MELVWQMTQQQFCIGLLIPLVVCGVITGVWWFIARLVNKHMEE